MKTIGLLGGMSWESTAEYYRIINEEVNRRLGSLHSASIVMLSLDFEKVAGLQQQERWSEAAEVMVDAAKRIEMGGADFMLICTNTMHKVFNEVESQINIPLIHIVDSTAEAIKSKDIGRIGLLGTKFTMEQDFLKAKLKEHGIKVIVPELYDREAINRIIYDELCLGKIKISSRQYLKDVIRKIFEEGGEGVVLGCTELPLLVRDEDSSVPLFDTCKIHAEKAVELSLQI